MISINKKKLIINCAIVMVAIIVSFFFREFIANYFVRINLKGTQMPKIEDRVLIFAPHNDDEVLGTGEFIKKSIKNGAKVQVVFMTNGDGFKQALEFDNFNLHPKKEDYIRFGYTRQKESINALNFLGLKGEDIIFLGYPDGGLNYLWTTNWDKENPHLSKNTETKRSPYNNSYTQNAIYAGESVIEDISKIINEYKPTYIIYPHPNDRHPDHWATNSFVKYALAALKITNIDEWLYIVHRGDWPTPMKKEPNMYLVPPAKLIGIGTEWHSLDLTDDEIKEKQQAINLYKTQIKVLGPLMNGFVRKNELFGKYDNYKLKLGNKNNKIIEDPKQDNIKLEMKKSNDIVALYMEVDSEKNLNISLELDGKVEEETVYCINSVLFYKDKIKRLNLQVKNNKVSIYEISKQSINNIKGVNINIKGKVISITVPNGIIGGFESVFINANTYVGDKMVDKTSWRMVEYY